MMVVTPAILHTRTGAHAVRVKRADTFLSRLKGLMFSGALPDDQGLLLIHCASVHTAFMRHAIDVVYLDKAGTALKCVPHLAPWRASVSHAGRGEDGKRHVCAAHTLELSAGTIARLDIRPGDWLEHPLWPRDASCPAPGRTGAGIDMPSVSGVMRPTRCGASRRQSGAAMLEFAVVGPVITLLGLAVLQYGMLFFAKNQINHAAFMAARAGATGNASLSGVKEAYIKALIPLYGGGTNATELAQAQCKARDAVEGTSNCLGESNVPGARIEMLNPTKDSFDDWNDPALQNAIGKGRRVIPNGSLAFKNASQIGSNSGQNIQDANLIKLRFTHAYTPKVPLMGLIYTRYLKWLDSGTDAFQSQVIRSGRIPVVTHVTLQMQSDAIEPDNPVSIPGMGNNGNPTDPGSTGNSGGAGGAGGSTGEGGADGGGGLGSSGNPPDCLTIGCTVENEPLTPTEPGGGGDGGGGGCTGGNCSICPDAP